MTVGVAAGLRLWWFFWTGGGGGSDVFDLRHAKISKTTGVK